jgi:hypothetical protein
MNSNQFVGSLLVGAITFVVFASGQESARNCSATCVGLPVAVLPSEVHIPEGNNNTPPAEYAVMMYHANNYNVLVQGNRA